MHRRLSRSLLAGVLGACAAVPPPPPAPEPPTPPFPFSQVWNRTAGAELVGDSARYPLPRVAMRLEVVSTDSAGPIVRCVACLGSPSGRLAAAEMVVDTLPPGVAARVGLAELVVAVRSAASRRDIEALRPVLSRLFTHSLAGGDSPIEAEGAWRRERFRTLDLVPALLDGGVVDDGPIWVAPPDFVERPGFTGLRTGFAREDGVWKWIFLTRSGY